MNRDYSKHAVDFEDELDDTFAFDKDGFDFDDDTFDDSVNDMEYVRMIRSFPPAQRDLLL